MNTSILKLKATVIRPKDDDELDGLAASISFPVECDDEAIGEALGDHDLMAYVVGELHDLVVRMRPEWLDNEDTSLTRMVCRLNPATNILMTNTSPYRFSSVRAIFLFTKKFLGGEAVDQLCERLRIISAISKHTSTQSTTPPKPAEPVL